MRLIKDSFIMGLAIFAIFFGAGNLILPPKLGLETGSEFIYATAGYMLTGVILPVMGLISVYKAGGSADKFSANLGKKGKNILTVVIFLIIGPLLAVPRTAATSFEVIFNSQSGDDTSFRIIYGLVYFAVVLFFVFKNEKVIEHIGKFLTPVLLILLFTIIVKGVFFTKGVVAVTNYPKSFETGFFKGYQTMDALAAVMLGGILTKYMNAKGYDRKKAKSVIWIAATVAMLSLACIYGGLLHTGAKFSGLLPNDMHQVETLVIITEKVLGEIGRYMLAACVLFACITTAIGMLSSAADYFSGLTGHKISYRNFILIMIVVSYMISIMGVELILKMAAPALTVIYPVIIVLIITNLFKITSEKAFQTGAVIGALIVSLADGMGMFGLKINIMQALPLYNEGLGWLFPALCGGLLASITPKKCARTLK